MRIEDRSACPAVSQQMVHLRERDASPSTEGVNDTDPVLAIPGLQSGHREAETDGGILRAKEDLINVESINQEVFIL